MGPDQFRSIILTNFNYDPTDDQLEAIDRFSKFVFNLALNSVFILRGYAGTGKTTMVNSLVTSLPKIGKNAILLAPTGRSAKVLANYTKRPASTIHRHIYRSNPERPGAMSFSLKDTSDLIRVK